MYVKIKKREEKKTNNEGDAKRRNVIVPRRIDRREGEGRRLAILACLSFPHLLHAQTPRPGVSNGPFRRIRVTFALASTSPETAKRQNARSVLSALVIPPSP